MRCKIFLPYIDFNDSNFYASSSYYKENDYETALRDSFNEKGMRRHEVSSNEENMSYATTECELFDEQNNLIDIDKLVSLAVSNDVSLLIVKLDFDTMDEEFESDFKLWYDAHIKINSNKLMGADIKFANEPKRTMKLEFKNLKNENTYLELVNCKILESVGDDSFAILIERINFSKKV